MHQLSRSVVPLVLLHARHPSLRTELLFVLGVPEFLLIRFLVGLTSHKVLLIETININAKVFSHKADTKRMGEAANFERLSCHRAVGWALA